MKDQRGVVYLETLVAFIPVFLFFLATVQIADLSAAHIIVRHAATVAARAAVVVMPDDGRYYNDEDNAMVHQFAGERRQHIEHAADLILGANPRLNRGSDNVQVGFKDGGPKLEPSADKYEGKSREELLELAMSKETAGDILDTSTRGDGEQGMRSQLDTLITASYRCLLNFFCPRDYTMRASASLVYQGARFTYEAWPDSIRSDADTPPPASSPTLPPGIAGPPPGDDPNDPNPGDPSDPGGDPTNPGTLPDDAIAGPPSNPSNPGSNPAPGSSSPNNPANPGSTGSNPANPSNPGTGASTDPGSGPIAALPPGGTNPPGAASSSPGSSSSSSPGSSSNGSSPGSSSNGSSSSSSSSSSESSSSSDGPVASSSSGATNPANPSSASSASSSNANTEPVASANNGSPTNPSSSASSSSQTNSSSGAVASNVPNSSSSSSNARPSLVAQAPSDSETPTFGGASGPFGSGHATNSGSNDDDGDRGDRPDPTHPSPGVAASTPNDTAPDPNSDSSTTASQEGTRTPTNPGRGPAPTRGPPTSDAESDSSTQGVIAGAVSDNDVSTSAIAPTEGTNRETAQPSTADIIASGEGGNRAQNTTNQAGRRTTPRNIAALRAALPSNLRNVPIVHDPSLRGSTVRVHYTHNERGVITGIEIRVGADAQARHITDHVNTVRTMQRYQGLSGRIRIALAKIGAWIARHPDVRPGSLAWETRREVEKLRAIVDARTRALNSGALTDAERAELERELASYEQQLAQHEAALAEITSEPGRGYVAAEDTGRTPEDFLRDLDNLDIYVDVPDLIDAVLPGATITQDSAIVRKPPRKPFGHWIGDLGELVAARYLADQGYNRLIVIKNNSGHGIDIIAIDTSVRPPRIAVVEVKSYHQGHPYPKWLDLYADGEADPDVQHQDESHRAPDLSADQEDAHSFVEDRLERYATRNGYPNITDEQVRAAQILLDWYRQDRMATAALKIKVGITTDGRGWQVTNLHVEDW